MLKKLFLGFFCLVIFNYTLAVNIHPLKVIWQLKTNDMPLIIPNQTDTTEAIFVAVQEGNIMAAITDKSETILDKIHLGMGTQRPFAILIVKAKQQLSLNFDALHPTGGKGSYQIALLQS